MRIAGNFETPSWQIRRTNSWVLVGEKQKQLNASQGRRGRRRTEMKRMLGNVNESVVRLFGHMSLG